MTAGQPAILTCRAHRLCRTFLEIYWEWTKADGQSIIMHGGDLDYYSFFIYLADTDTDTDRLHLTPTADDHNTNITCVAGYGDITVKTTVTLAVECKYAAVFL